ncbi:hypothetical protein [Amycolatopsis pigmentata]|uniref:Uncharacterized protein n=1 Tax=Amycolatopsis pigmentata TaxID=450801 RepID=A0ABW5FX78_9PSEU
MARHRFEEKDDRVRWGGPALVEDYVRRAHQGGAHSVKAPHEPPAHERLAEHSVFAGSLPAGA